MSKKISQLYKRFKPQPDIQFERMPRCINEGDDLFRGIRHNLKFRGWYWAASPDYPIAIFECACGRLDYESNLVAKS